MNTPRPTLGAQIRELRKQRGWSQHQAAERVGVQPLAYGKWERDEANPSTENTVKLARVFGIDATELGYEAPIWTPSTPPDWAVRYHDEIMERLNENDARLTRIEKCLSEEAVTVKSLEEQVIAYIRCHIN